jgi:integrase
MASISTDQRGLRRLLFKGLNGNRRSIRLGKIQKRAAESIKQHVEHLLSCNQAGLAFNAQTSEWLNKIDQSLRTKLEKHGLVSLKVHRVGLKLSNHIAAYRERISHLKPSTQTHWNHTFRNLATFFSRDPYLSDITAGDAKDFQIYLLKGKARSSRRGKLPKSKLLAVNTVAKRISNCKALFKDAISRKQIDSNPFEGLRGTVRSNPERDYFITLEESTKVLEACPNAEWRLIFALARFGGLRVPSEIVGLKWEHIDWANNRLLVLSPKTEHHEGKKNRVVPIFGELKPFLEEQFELAVPGNEFVMVDHRCTNANLRKMLLTIIERAGLIAWPKLYHNLRASRATELVRDYPAHVVAAWLGHSVRIAAEHYLQVTEDDFEKAAQNAAQHMHVMPRIDSQPQNTAHEKRLVLPSNASSRNTMQASQVGDEGLEPPTSSV